MYALGVRIQCNPLRKDESKHRGVLCENLLIIRVDPSNLVQKTPCNVTEGHARIRGGKNVARNRSTVSGWKSSS